MTNRKLIERFCLEHGFEIIELRFERDTDACYGDTWRSDYWDIRIKFGDVLEDFHTIRAYATLTDDIYKMFDCMTDLSCWWEN